MASWGNKDKTYTDEEFREYMEEWRMKLQNLKRIKLFNRCLELLDREIAMKNGDK